MKNSTAEDCLKKNDLLFQPALATLSKIEPSSPKLQQICSICDLEVEGGKFFEHLATAHSNSKESPATPEKLNSKVAAIPKNIIVPETVVTAASLKLITQGKNPIANPIGLVFNKERTQQKPLTLEEKIEAFNIKPCEIKLTKCDDLINCDALLTFKSISVSNSKIQKKVTPEKSKLKTDSAKKYLCLHPKCKKKFKFKHHLKIHSVVHSGEKPHKCKVCFRRFTQQSSLKRHSRLHIDGKYSLKCTSQPSKREQSLPRVGETECDRKLYKCPFPGCNKAFGAPSQMQIHYRIHTGEKPFQCKVCLKRFNQSCYLPVHSRIHTGDKPFQCKTCFKRFTQSGSLSLHVKSIHGKSISRASVRKIKKESESLSKNMASIENIKNINKTGTGLTTVSLELINNDSNATAELSLEEKIKSSNVKPCEIKLTKCDNLINCADHSNISNKTDSKIQGKVKREKSKWGTDSAKQISKLHLCSYPKCEKYFKSNYQLEIHSRVHSGEKPYKCKVCCRRFTQQSSLNRHSKMHFEGQKSLKRTSQHSSGLKQSLSRVGKTESNRKLHRCSFPGCNKAFAGRGNLEIHYRIHTGEKPFQCKVCFKRFNQSSYLTVHSRIHTGDKPFQCKTCFKWFTQSSSLTLHVKNVHGKSNSRTSVRKMQKESKSLPRTGSSKNQKNVRSKRQKEISSLKVKSSKGQAHLVKKTQTKPPAKATLSLQTPKEKVFACLGCSKRDTNLSNLELHIKQAHGLELGAKFDRTLLLCKTSN